MILNVGTSGSASGVKETIEVTTIEHRELPSAPFYPTSFQVFPRTERGLRPEIIS